jgi:hypothetical protein
MIERGGKSRTVKSYWLHILASRSPEKAIPDTYVLSRADAPHSNFQGGAMPAVHLPSWDDLEGRLHRVGVDDAELVKARKGLDSSGSYTITEVHLKDDQVRQLGFTDI